ncbi:signal peptidase II [Hwanghaeella grinnelliae]|uniref:Lipoprotein signal peptidase n=2 Tax=Hwanghaeella grinnelliae TaxID=2500179 RepID=A0A3S2VST0_9PROT|nr:signal peptidase II [Hwanghaeella grinnelliae]
MPETAAGSRSLVGLGLVICGVTIILDQISKWVFLDIVQSANGTIEVTGFFNLVMVWNRGVSFGMFSDHAELGRWGLSGLALAITIGLFFWLRKVGHWMLAMALGLVMGGAVGNVIDRVRFGAVFDFLDLHAAGYHWPAFNVADSAIVVGVGLILLDGLLNNTDKAA